MGQTRGRIAGMVACGPMMSADLELGLCCMLPMEAATNDFYGGHRQGINLFRRGVSVCLDARTR